jgi:2-keto-3-deoxy-6-phosphogluconate aldolase
MAQRAINAGAKFLSCDYMDLDIINVAKNNDNFVIQGVFTPTEAFETHQLGADLVKVYPAAEAGGPNYLRYLRNSLPFAKFVAAGGITSEDAFDYLKNCIAVFLGKAIFDKALVRANNWSEIRERAKQFTTKLEALKVSK